MYWMPVAQILVLSPCADYGFDPIGLGSSPEALERFAESEILHCRWAMLGAVSALG